MSKRRSAEKDAKRIEFLAKSGDTLEEIMEKMSLSKSQIDYSIRMWLPSVKERKVRQLLSDNNQLKETTQQESHPIQTQTEKKITPPTFPIGKTKAILFDTSIINISALIDIVKENEDSIFIFSTIVIEELENMKSILGFKGFNARELLSLAIRSNSQVILAEADSVSFSLEGWSDTNKDSRIIKMAIDMRDQYDITIYTCDKVFALKAKSHGFETEYRQSESQNSFREVVTHIENDSPKTVDNQKDIETTNIISKVFRKVIEVDELRSLNFVKQKGFYYILNYKGFPYYNSNFNRDILDYQRKIFLKIGTTIYKTERNRIEKYVIEKFSKENNARLVKVGVFSEELSTINQMQIVILIGELG